MTVKLIAQVPNSIVLNPEIGKENLLLYKETILALEKVNRLLQELQVKTIVIISNRGLSPTTGLCFNVNYQFNINFSAYGDLSRPVETTVDLPIIDYLQEKLASSIKLSYISLEPLDYGSALILNYFKNWQDNYVTIYNSHEDHQVNHFYGTKIFEALQQNPTEIAILVTSNLSNRLINSPDGYLFKARGYDKKIIHDINHGTGTFLASLSEEESKTYYEHGTASFSLLTGIISAQQKKPKLLSYEHPLGVGWSVMASS